MARALAATLIPPPRRPPPPETEEEPVDFLTAAQLARRLGVSRETVRRLAIARALPHTVVCHGARKTTRRYPRRFAEEFAASGLDTADLAAFAAAWLSRHVLPRAGGSWLRAAAPTCRCSSPARVSLPGLPGRSARPSCPVTGRTPSTESGQLPGRVERLLREAVHLAERAGLQIRPVARVWVWRRRM